MGARLVPPVLSGAFILLLAVSFGAAASRAETVPVVVGSVRCLDCSPNDVNAEDAFKELQVAIKCKSGAGETYETQSLTHLDGTGAFRIPLAAGLVREDGELDHDCFAQLHSAPDTPCAGAAPPKIAPAGGLNSDRDGESTANTYFAVADDTILSPVACACGKKKKKHFMLRGPPPPPRPEPSYGPPTPTPTPTPTPVPTPSYGPPTPKPPVEDEPEPFHKKMKKMMHKKKPCPPLVDDDKTQLPKN